MVDAVKRSLRMSNSTLDDDIATQIEICKADLKSGGAEYVDGDPLSRQAVFFYCRWQFDYLGKAEKWKTAYKELKIVLALRLEAEANE